MCHLWPSISPQGRHHPGSVWRLPYYLWFRFASAADAWDAAQAEAAKPKPSGGRRR